MAQPGSILWGYVRRFVADNDNTVINITPIKKPYIQATNSSTVTNDSEARKARLIKPTTKAYHYTKSEMMEEEGNKNAKPAKKQKEGEKPSIQIKQVSKEAYNTKATSRPNVLKNKFVLRAKQHIKESSEKGVKKPVKKFKKKVSSRKKTTKGYSNHTAHLDNVSKDENNKLMLRSKQERKPSDEIENSDYSEFVDENNAKKNETQSEVETMETTAKSPLRSGPDGKTTKKQRFRSNPKLTAMPYQIQEDEGAQERLKNMYRTHNEHLNPYAINRQMLRYVDENSDEMNIHMEIIGRTVEYNDIILLKMSEKDKIFRAHKYAKEVPEKKILFIVHGLSILGMGELINDEKKFKTLMNAYARHLNLFDIFVIPMANPDGYAAILNSQEGKFWNKNMSPQSNCAGVALDRNFDVEWNASSDISSCSHVYPGPIPFSEAETRAIREVFHLYGHKIVAYIHLHASTYSSKIFKGDAILHPRGYSTDHNDDDKYIDIKADIEDAMKNASFKVLSVTVEPLFRWYGIVTGSSVDFASSVYGIPYAMEFCMQAYTHLEDDALNQIWRRIIDVTFENIWRNDNDKNVKKK